MKLLKSLLALACVASLVSTGGLYADEQDGSRFDEELNERDFDALRDYLRSKRTLDIEESTSTLTISGDVRTEYRHLNESCNNRRLRGPGVVIKDRPVSRNDYDIEFNLRFDYVCEKAWASAHVRYDNSAGVDDNGHPCKGTNNGADDHCCIRRAGQCLADPEGYHGSGACDDLCLKKAYMGYELYSCGAARCFFELGRRGNLYNAFDSNIQFLSRFDGLLLKYENSWDCVADWYIQGAGFLVDERVNHWGCVAEIGLLNIADSHFDFKYSIINWVLHGKNRCETKHPKGFRFVNSQFTAAYNMAPEWIGIQTKVYGAFLVNHAADQIKTEIEDDKGNVIGHKRYGRKNLGWYAGVLFGKVRKEGDWALEIQYQYVQAQAMPDDDCAGICRGNILDESFTTCAMAGNTNYKGWRLQGLYAFTDNLTLDSIIEWSRAEDSSIGGKHTYSKVEMEAIYAF